MINMIKDIKNRFFCLYCAAVIEPVADKQSEFSMLSTTEKVVIIAFFVCFFGGMLYCAFSIIDFKKILANLPTIEAEVESKITFDQLCASLSINSTLTIEQVRNCSDMEDAAEGFIQDQFAFATSILTEAKERAAASTLPSVYEPMYFKPYINVSFYSDCHFLCSEYMEFLVLIFNPFL